MSANGPTNLSTLVLACDVCRHTMPAAGSIRDHDTCGEAMRLANTTDRDGAPVHVEFPYEAEAGA